MINLIKTIFTTQHDYTTNSDHNKSENVEERERNYVMRLQMNDTKSTQSHILWDSNQSFCLIQEKINHIDDTFNSYTDETCLGSK